MVTAYTGTYTGTYTGNRLNLNLRIDAFKKRVVKQRKTCKHWCLVRFLLRRHLFRRKKGLRDTLFLSKMTNYNLLKERVKNLFIPVIIYITEMIIIPILTYAVALSLSLSLVLSFTYHTNTSLLFLTPARTDVKVL